MKKEETVHFKINIPVSLKQRLEHVAVDNRRSLTAEIIGRLEESFERPKGGGIPPQVVTDLVTVLLKKRSPEPEISPFTIEAIVKLLQQEAPKKLSE